MNGVLWRVCTECQICYKNCPAGAISFVNGAASIDKDKCIGCNACYYTCPEHCINPEKLQR
ncbi:MAG: 4Fe-4S binding protein [Solobacterium sp.]|nr:4Fe-4S binding protein [Solobacterium sp.]